MVPVSRGYPWPTIVTQLVIDVAIRIYKIAKGSNAMERLYVVILAVIMNADGSGVENLTQNDTEEGVARFVPHANQISYESKRSGIWNLYLLDLSTKHEIQLTDSPGIDVLGVWSPSGKCLAHEHKPQDGTWGIVILNIETKKEQRLSINLEK